MVPIRLMVGYGFFAHGWAKLARGPDGFAAVLAAMGIPMPALAAWATTLVELVGGIALMVGVAMLPFCIPLAAVMLTAMVGVHLRYGFSSIRLMSIGSAGAQFGPIGYELNLLYLPCLLRLLVARTEPLSMDRWLAARRRLRQARSTASRAGRTRRPSR